VIILSAFFYIVRSDESGYNKGAPDQLLKRAATFIRACINMLNLSRPTDVYNYR